MAVLFQYKYRVYQSPPPYPPAPAGISVVIPCLNEEQSIAAVVGAANDGIRGSGLTGEVIVVDNGSTDASVERAREAGARVVREETRGYGAALRRGFAEARFEYLVMGDGDLTYDFREMPPFIARLERGESDLVVGNRWGDMRKGAMPFLHRYVGNPLLSGMLRVMFHTSQVRDMHCGMRAIRRSRWLQLGCVTEGMEFASEMIVRAARVGLRMSEIPIAYHPRVGESKLSSFRDGWRHMRFMLLHSPSWVLLGPGALLWAASMFLIALLAVADVTVRGRSIQIHTMIVAGLLNVTSLQILTMGVVALAYAHVSGLRRNPMIDWFYRRLTFERLVLLTLPLVLGGLAFTFRVVLHWALGGFGQLHEARALLFGALLLIDSVQICATGYVLSIMGLPRPRYPDGAPPRRP
jgi:glycosyltransferase involved in cell wall biosynthesis